MLVKRVVDGIVIETEITQEEIENMQQENQNQVQELTLEDKIASLQDENQFLKDCILELSEIVYGG